MATPDSHYLHQITFWEKNIGGDQLFGFCFLAPEPTSQTTRVRRFEEQRGAIERRGCLHVPNVMPCAHDMSCQGHAHDMLMTCREHAMYEMLKTCHENVIEHVMSMLMAGSLG